MYTWKNGQRSFKTLHHNLTVMGLKQAQEAHNILTGQLRSGEFTRARVEASANNGQPVRVGLMIQHCCGGTHSIMRTEEPVCQQFIPLLQSSDRSA